MVDSALIIEGIKAIKATYDQIKKVKKLKPITVELEERIKNIEIILNNSVLEERIRNSKTDGLRVIFDDLNKILNEKCAQYLLELSRNGDWSKVKKFFNARDHIEQYKDLVNKLDSALISISLALNIEGVEMTRDLQVLAMEQQHRDDEKSEKLDKIHEKLDGVCKDIGQLNVLDQRDSSAQEPSQIIKMERKSNGIPPGFSIHLCASYTSPLPSFSKANSQDDNCEEKSWLSWLCIPSCCRQ